MKNHSRLLVKSTSVYTLTNILISAGSIIMMPLYTRILSPYQYGVLGIVMPIINFIPLFFVFGIYSAQRRLYIDYNKNNEMSSYIYSVNLFLLLINAAALILFISPPGRYLLNLVFNFKIVPFGIIFLALLIGFIKVFTLMANTFHEIKYNLSRISISKISGFIINHSVAVILIIFIGFGVKGKIIGILSGSVLAFLLMFIPYIRHSKIGRIRWKYIKASLIIGFPITIKAFTDLFINYSDRLVLARYQPIETVGMYSIAYTAGFILTVFIVSFNNAWVPIFNELIGSERENRFEIVRIRLNDFLITVILLCIAGQVFGIDLISLFLPSEYIEVSIFFPYILFGIVFFSFSHYLTNIIVFYKETIYLPIVSVLAGGVNLTLNIIFIPRYGALVAAYTTILSYALVSVSMFIFVKIRYKSFRFDYVKLILILLFAFNPILFEFAKVSTVQFLFAKILYIALYIIIFRKNLGKIFKILMRRKE